MTESSENRLLFNPEEALRSGREFCFLCGLCLTPELESPEHIIPKWIQERYDLWDQRLTLLNRTTIPYRQLTIPCCSPCNTEHLSKIETQVRRACAAGRDAVLSLPPLTLFLWAGKILYGIVYREHLVPSDRQAAEEGPLVPTEFLEEFRLHHRFLQAARIPMEFLPHVPC